MTMPSNPVDEARQVLYNRESPHEYEKYRGHLADIAAFERAIREQERSRYEGLLADALDALRENITTWITLHPLLNEPYPDDPRWTPWTRFGKRAADRAVEAQTAIRAVLYAAPPTTPSAPAEKEG